jgi:tetratricopeptide (TPR) repeat protein
MSEKSKKKSTVVIERVIFLAAIALLFLAIWLTAPKADRGSVSEETNATTRLGQQPAQGILNKGAAFFSRNAVMPEARDAERIVAEKLIKFSAIKRSLVRRLAQRFGKAVPPEVERFFDLVDQGRLEEACKLFDELNKEREGPPPKEDLYKIWRPIQDTAGISWEALNWPAQRLLDYGNSILSSLAPGMVFIGGTDPGCFIPTFLNDTAEGDQHIVMTQNALADSTYLDYLSELYGDRMKTLDKNESESAFQAYIGDLQKRIDHDKANPNEPKRVKSEEKYEYVDGKLNVSGQGAVMAINERLFQRLMEKNPDLRFAVEESFPFKSTYGDATPLGPIMELRVGEAEKQLSPERAAETLAYWQTTNDQILSDPESSNSDYTRRAYSKIQNSQANLFAERGLTGEAEQTYRMALQLYPANIEAVNGMIDLLSRNGDITGARRVLDDFARVSPDQKAAADRFFHERFPRHLPGNQ